MNLVEFLRARLDEDEKLARDLLVDAQSTSLMLQEPKLLGKCIPGWHDWPRVERMCTARLAEVDANRKILNEHFGFLYPGGNPDRACRRCSDLRADDDPLIRADRWIKLEPSPCATLRLLARPYAAHPDYRDEWKP